MLSFVIKSINNVLFKAILLLHLFLFSHFINYFIKEQIVIFGFGNRYIIEHTSYQSGIRLIIYAPTYGKNIVVSKPIFGHVWWQGFKTKSDQYNETHHLSVNLEN